MPSVHLSCVVCCLCVLSAVCPQTDNVRVLIPCSDVNAEDAHYRTPLFLAALGSHAEIVDLLLAAKADWRMGKNVLFASCAVGSLASTWLCVHST